MSGQCGADSDDVAPFFCHTAECQSCLDRVAVMLCENVAIRTAICRACPNVGTEALGKRGGFNACVALVAL